MQSELNNQPVLHIAFLQGCIDSSSGFWSFAIVLQSAALHCVLHDVTWCYMMLHVFLHFLCLNIAPFYLSILLPEICQLPLSFPHVSMRNTFQNTKGPHGPGEHQLGLPDMENISSGYHLVRQQIFFMNNKSTSWQKILEWDWPIDRLTNWPIQWVQSCL